MDSIIKSIYEHKEKDHIIHFLINEEPSRCGWTQMYADDMTYIYDIFKENNIDFSSQSHILYDVQKKLRDKKIN